VIDVSDLYGQDALLLPGLSALLGLAEDDEDRDELLRAQSQRAALAYEPLQAGVAGLLRRLVDAPDGQWDGGTSARPTRPT
jgi:hypothetical protein